MAAKTSKPIQFIVAGNHGQARRCAAACCLKIRDYSYIGSYAQCRGVPRGTSVWLYGTYYTLPGWHEIRRMLEANECLIIEVY